MIHALVKYAWIKKDLPLCLTAFGGSIIETGSDYYRLATTRVRTAQQPVS